MTELLVRLLTLWLDRNQIIDFVNDAIGSDDVAFRDASILDFGTTIAIETEKRLIQSLDASDEWPLRLGDASTA